MLSESAAPLSGLSPVLGMALGTGAAGTSFPTSPGTVAGIIARAYPSILRAQLIALSPRSDLLIRLLAGIGLPMLPLILAG